MPRKYKKDAGIDLSNTGRKTVIPKVRYYRKKPVVIEAVEEVEPGYVVVETALFFSKESSKYATDNEDYNLDFVRIQLMYLKSLLKIRGFLFLNEVAASLGIGLTPKGQTHGWLQSNDDFNFEIDSTPYNVRIVLPNISEMYQDI
jgi:hypothetical protein